MKQGLSLLIMGRPNVGKSTLFNRLLGKRVALTSGHPGTTRDWQVYDCLLGGLFLRLYDLPGLNLLDKEDLMLASRAQAEKLFKKCDAVLFLFDAKSGIHPDDHVLARWLHTQHVKVVLIANKVEKKMDLDVFSESFSLGFGDPTAISGLHGQGFQDLIRALEALPQRPQEDDLVVDGPIVAVLGRPNVGKSTFINYCLQEERLLVGAQAGITRDCITVTTHWHGKTISFVDTAGLRKRAQIHETLEKDACAESFHALFFSHVVLLLLDACRGLEKQDMTIFQKIEEEGRGVVIGVNKWDKIRHAKDYLTELRQYIDQNCQSKGLPVIPLSSKTGEGMDALANALFSVYDRWNIRISTRVLNQWLAQKMQIHSPPLIRGRPIKLKYMHQTKTRPPTFTIFGNQLEALDIAYKRYLVNALIRDFGLEGASIRLVLRSASNPYI